MFCGNINKCTKGAVVWLKVQPEGDSAVTFNWGNADGPHPCIYPIGRATLVGVAEKIRNILDQLADWAKFRDKEQLCDLLHDLAVEGKRLRFVIFDCPQK